MTDRVPLAQSPEERGDSKGESLPTTLRNLYELHFGHVWNTLRRLGIPERYLEDVVHDVFLVVHARLGDFDPGRPVKPWLFGISFRVAAGFRRRASFARELLDSVPDEADSRPTAEVQLADGEARRLLLKVLDSLEPERRAVFVAHELDEMGVPEIAAALGIPLNTAYSRLRLARTDFAQAARRLQPKPGDP